MPLLLMKLVSNRFTNELDSLGRIVVVIKAHRDWTADGQNLAANQTIDGYLEQHLSAPDWAFWQRLQIREQAYLNGLKMRDS
ncbi:hypothetical protein [Spirosoma arcticum]